MKIKIHYNKVFQLVFVITISFIMVACGSSSFVGDLQKENEINQLGISSDTGDLSQPGTASGGDPINNVSGGPADGDFLYAQIDVLNAHFLLGLAESDSSWQPDHWAGDICLVFKGITNDFPMPVIKNYTLFINGEARYSNVRLESPRVSQETLYSLFTPFDHSGWGDVTLYTIDVIFSDLDIGRIYLEPGEYWFEATVNGVHIRSNTFIYRTDGTAEYLDDMPAPSQPLSLLNVAETAPPTAAVPGERGNLSGNTYAALKGDWIYYTMYGSLYKMRTDGTGATLIDLDIPIGAGGYFQEIHVIGDWIYDASTWVRVRTDGTGFTKIADINGRMHSIVGDWIYYTDNSINGIFRIRTDGTGQEKLTNRDEPHMIHSVEGDWVYYHLGYADENEGIVFRVRTDGSAGEEMSIGGRVDNVRVYGDSLYFRGNGNALIRVNVNTMETMKIIDEDCLDYIVDGDWVYFTLIWSGWDDELMQTYIQKIRVNGTGYAQINDEISHNLNVVGDWIFYRIECDSGSYYRIRNDGTGREFVTQRP